jgi:hypothetical protein
MIGRRLAVGVTTLLAGASLGMTCGPGPQVTEMCTPAPIGSLPDATITSLEIGTMDGRAFIPFTDQGVAPLTIGGQGSDMIVTHLRLKGSGVPACLSQRTALEQLDGTEIATEQAAVPTEPDGDGGWVSGSMFMVYFGAPGHQIRFRSKVESVERTVVVWAGSTGTVDAGVDAP